MVRGLWRRPWESRERACVAEAPFRFQWAGQGGRLQSATDSQERQRGSPVTAIPLHSKQSLEMPYDAVAGYAASLLVGPFSSFATVLAMTF